MLKTFLNAAVAHGLTLEVRYGDEVDYVGTSVYDAIEAIEACDEHEVHLLDDAGQEHGWALIINDLDDDEKIADCSGIANYLIDNMEVAS